MDVCVCVRLHVCERGRERGERDREKARERDRERDLGIRSAVLMVRPCVLLGRACVCVCVCVCNVVFCCCCQIFHARACVRETDLGV